MTEKHSHVACSLSGIGLVGYVVAMIALVVGLAAHALIAEQHKQIVQLQHQVQVLKAEHK